MKKTLITKISQDISLANDAQIEALRAMWKASYAPLCFEVSFEVTEVDEESRLKALIEQVRREFALHDNEPEPVEDALSPVQRLALERLEGERLCDFLEK